MERGAKRFKMMKRAEDKYQKTRMEAALSKKLGQKYILKSPLHENFQILPHYTLGAFLNNFMERALLASFLKKWTLLILSVV